MITRQNHIRQILSNITNKEVDDAIVAKLANIAEAIDIKSNDALFPLMVALEYYKVIFESIPNNIQQVTNNSIIEHKKVLSDELNKITQEYQKDIIHSTTRLFENKIPNLIKDSIDKEIKISIDNSLVEAINKFNQATENNYQNIQKIKKEQNIKITVVILVFMLGLIIGKFI